MQILNPSGRTLERLPWGVRYLASASGILLLSLASARGQETPAASADPARASWERAGGDGLRAAVRDLCSRYPGRYPRGAAFLERLELVEAAFRDDAAAESAPADLEHAAEVRVTQRSVASGDVKLPDPQISDGKEPVDGQECVVDGDGPVAVLPHHE